MLVKDFDLLKNTKTNLNHLDMFLSSHQKKELFSQTKKTTRAVVFFVFLPLSDFDRRLS